MGFHLLTVLLTPTLLCLCGASASALWPARLVLWSCVAPAFVLAAWLLGLLGFRHELAGPVLHWCRVDVPGIVLTALALPSTAVLLRWPRPAASWPGLRASPWRHGLLQAGVVAAGILPLPCLVLVMPLLRPWRWRLPAAPVLVAVGALGTLLAWPWWRGVDWPTAAVQFTAAGCLQSGPEQRGYRLLLVAGGLLALGRGLLG